MPSAVQLNASKEAKRHLAKNYPRQTQKCMGVLVEVLKDGREHTSAEVIAALKEHGISKKHLPAAHRALNVQVHNGGGGQPWTYRLQGYTGEEAHPDVAVSSKILTNKAGPDAHTLKERLEANVPGYDPLVAMAQIAQDQSVPLALRLEIHQTLAKYLVPQVKAAEITTSDQPIALQFKWQN